MGPAVTLKKTPKQQNSLQESSGKDIDQLRDGCGHLNRHFKPACLCVCCVCTASWIQKK